MEVEACGEMVHEVKKSSHIETKIFPSQFFKY